MMVPNWTADLPISRCATPSKSMVLWNCLGGFSSAACCARKVDSATPSVLRNPSIRMATATSMAATSRRGATPSRLLLSSIWTCASRKPGLFARDSECRGFSSSSTCSITPTRRPFKSRRVRRPRLARFRKDCRVAKAKSVCVSRSSFAEIDNFITCSAILLICRNIDSRFRCRE